MNNRFRKYWIISGTIAFVIVFAFLVVEIYTRTLEDEKNDYQLQQLEMARNAGSGIEYFIEHLSRDMKFLSVYPEIQKLNTGSLSFLNGYFDNYGFRIINSIIITDKRGSPVYSTSNPVPSWVRTFTMKTINDSSGRLNDTLYANYYIMSDVFRNEDIQNNDSIYVQLLTPLTVNKDTTGYLILMINFNQLIDQFIKPLKLTKGDFAWIIDGSGRLIYHPKHDEMLFYSLEHTSNECFNCHVSFEPQKKMLNTFTPSMDEYPVIGDEPPKLLAYYPITIQNKRWMLVVSAFVTNVTENLRDKFRLFFILGFVILGVIIFFGLLIYYLNAKRIRAEDAKKNLEELQVYQEQLNQASKMASIGELVDSVAHEINTPAGIISAHIDGVMLKDAYPDSLAETFRIIKKQTQRISAYTRTLLNYSQRIPFEPELLNLRSVIDECLFLVNHGIHAKQISVNKNLSNDLPDIYADRRQLEQVFINIINNAVDASSVNGEIIIFASAAEPGTEQGVQIVITDKGSGIPAGDVDKIFTPFFSTKLNSNGTGLGLSITKAIIQRHNGTITAKSNDGEGTSFRIFLPIKLKEGY